MQKLYFRTTTGACFNARKTALKPQGENFNDVHYIGQRVGKYMGYQLKSAPLLDRTSCEYNRDYIELPLDDIVITRQMAEANKGRVNSNALGGSAAPFDHVTKYKDDFKPPSRKEARGAIGTSAKPKACRTSMLPSGELLEKWSFSHQVFGAPHRLTPSERAVPPKSNLGPLQRYGPITTAYQEQFTPPITPADRHQEKPRCSSAPAGGRSGRRKDQGGGDAADAAPATQSKVRPASAVDGHAKQRRERPEKSTRPASAVSWFRPASAETVQLTDSSLAAVAPASSVVLRQAAAQLADDEFFQIRRACYLDVGR